MELLEGLGDRILVNPNLRLAEWARVAGLGVGDEDPMILLSDTLDALAFLINQGSVFGHPASALVRAVEQTHRRLLLGMDSYRNFPPGC